MRKNRIDFVTMGCSKNLVDSERLMGQLEANGFHCVHDPEYPQGEIAVINTCGFIGDAKEESIEMILRFAEAKKAGKLRKLYVMGCLSQRYQGELEKEIPEVDKYFGKFNYRDLLVELGKAELPVCDGQRCLTTPSHYAYLKISEGCDRHCAYCAIPLMTGRHVSRPMDEILREVERLVAQGVKEFQVIAQELTYYGRDIDGQSHITELVNRMAMRRHVTKQETLDLLREIRSRVPGIHIRTTLMVGFPGETEKDFNELMQFVKDERFERMGAFAYSEEEGTYSARHYKDDISPEEKQRRLDKLMALQQTISAEVEAEKVGQVMRVIIDRKEGDYYVGRTEYCSPEVDPEVLVSSDKPLRIGDFYQVRITDSEEFDIYAELA